MPKSYSRHCDFCGDYYEGYGEKYCSLDCAGKDQRKERDDPTDLPETASDRVEFTVSGNRATANAIALPRILTLDELLDVCEVDLRVWEVDRYKVNKWESAIRDDNGQPDSVQLFQVKATLTKRPDAPLAHAIDAALDKMADHAPKYPDTPTPIIKRKGERHMLELVLPDLHLGMLAWARETGRDYDSDIAIDRYKSAVGNLLTRCRTYPLESIVLVIGNDFFHTDRSLEGKGGLTTAGTPQDVDTRRAKMVETGCDLLVEVVDNLLKVAPVKVVACPGNHDRDETLNAARYLSAWYRNCDSVEVDAEPSPRKYHLYGNTLLGFTHGKEEKVRDLPSVMAVERPQLWSQSTFREWHLGHIHKKREYSPIYVDEHQGVRVRHLSPLTGTDAWHHRRGYIGNVRSAEAFVWNHDTGLASIAHWNVAEPKRAA